MADPASFQSRARFALNLPDARFDSFRAAVANYGAAHIPGSNEVALAYPFGTLDIVRTATDLTVKAQAGTADRLARLQEIVATAGRNHIRDADTPDVIPSFAWEGDLADATALAQFRLMRVGTVSHPAGNVKRVRLHGANLDRFRDLGGYHVRLLLPTSDNPDPQWPVRGADGLPAWPDPARQPVARVYTIRDLDVAAGWMDIDFVLHAAPGPGSDWARRAREGDRIGIIGPLGRPIRPASFYLLGADDTGLPALARILRELPDTTAGIAVLSVADASGTTELLRPPGVALRWLYRDKRDPTLADRLCAAEWPHGTDSYGWCAADDRTVAQVRARWRGPDGPGRDRSLTAIYWRHGDRAQTR